jgi:MFS family permease
MHTRRENIALFTLEGVNSFATTLYFYYIYFFTERQFGFTKLQNLLLAAAMGLVYGLASIVGGRFAQKRGYFTALKTGYLIMAAATTAGVFLNPLATHLLLMFITMAGAAFTWPPLEALVSEGESGRGLQRRVGIYNLVWGGFGAFAYFSGGALIKATTFSGMFLVPAILNVLQLISAVSLERSIARHMAQDSAITVPEATQPLTADESEQLRSPVSPKVFLRMAWLANPFAYLAVNTVIAVMPALAHRLGLSVAQAGIVCSLWLFVRTASFLTFWLWPGWHYRFRWLLGAFFTMTVSFSALLLAADLWLVIIAQIFFGLALGLIYYSSLYYSMHVGDTKGEHGGFHEAMIGAGSCAGPAIGAAALYLAPHQPSSSTWAVLGLLFGGCAGLLWLRFRSR